MGYKLGSLFDGSGTCPLAATMCGITPTWASEIEPYPVRVTTARFPTMQHLGDITKIDGARIPPVDIVTFGSPCQDMSVAGRHAGLKGGERSSLFYEATRIIREMRSATNGKYPRFAVWENVPGAFSSNKGEDFRCVLEEFLAFAEGRLPATVPMPTDGRWSRAGLAVGEGFSLAWRTLDARYWGVPQRRRRIYLVADFGGGRAGEVLFEREGVRRDHPSCGKPWEGAAADAAGGSGGSGGAECLTPWDCQSKRIYGINGAYPALQAMERSGANNEAVIYPAGPVPSLCARADSSPCIDRGQPFVACALQANGIDRADNAGCNGAGIAKDGCYTLNTMDRHCVAYPVHPEATGALMRRMDRGLSGQNGFNDMLPVYRAPDHRPRKWIVRRLTPLECCRLQGFYDWWEDGVPAADAPRYRMWGNGMALPCMQYVMEGLRFALQHDT